MLTQESVTFASKCEHMGGAWYVQHCVNVRTWDVRSDL